MKYALKHKIVGKPSSQEELISELEDKDYGFVFIKLSIKTKNVKVYL